MLRIVTLVIVFLIVSVHVCAQQKVPSVGWDFSYKSLLERNNVAKSEWNWKWLARYRSPAEDWVKNWVGKPIVSLILIEYPNFHAGERTTMLLIRTADEAFYWESVEEKEKDKNEEPISPQIYDAVYKQATTWKQLTPKSAADRDKDELPGYFGFLSLYGPDGSKQMLLTTEDFFLCLEKSCMPGKRKAGRLMAAIEPVLIPEKQTYKHKSEAEIARMTPEQRIDEQISEEDHAWDPTDQHSFLIQKYRRIDGVKGFSHLIQLIDGYIPRRQRDIRFFSAMMMAANIDERAFRLRASPEGRNVIAAIERLYARMAAEGRKDAMVEMVLDSSKGVNLADEAVRDTLWVNHRIKIADSELLELSNYLVKLDPTYPSWSQWNYIKDYSRINEAGNPDQVFVFKQPVKYYRAFLDFRKTRPKVK